LGAGDLRRPSAEHASASALRWLVARVLIYAEACGHPALLTGEPYTAAFSKVIFC